MPYRDPLSRRETIVLLSALGGTLLLKLMYLVFYSQAVPFYSVPMGDSAIYLDWAGRILGGDFWGLEEPFRVFYRAPLYPYLLALFLKVFGGSLLPVYVFQQLLGVLNLFMAFLIARRLFTFRAGIATIILGALYAPLSLLETKLVSVTLVITLLLLTAWLLLRAQESRARLHWLLAGLATGLGTLAWGGTIVLVPLVFLFWLFRRKQARFALVLLFGVGWFALVLPAFLHNTLVGNDLVLVNSNSGYTFYQGNNPASSGTIVHPPEVYEQTFGGKYLTGIGEQELFDRLYASRALERDSLKPSEASAFWLNRGLSWMKNHPGDFIRLEFQKLVLLLANTEFASNYHLSVEQDLVPFLLFLFVPFSLILALGVVGMVFTFRDRGRQWPVYLPVVATVLTLLVFYVGFRYRLPLVLPLAVFAGAGVDRVLARFSQRKFPWAELGLASVVLAVSWVLCSVPLRPRHAFVTALGYRNLGDIQFRAQGNAVKAKRALNKALALHEENDYFGRTVLSQDALSEVLTFRGDVFMAEGKLDSAIADFKRAWDATPQQVAPLSKLAFAWYRKGSAALDPRSDEGRAALDTALTFAGWWQRGDTTDIQPIALKGDIELARADTAAAVETYERLISGAPGFEAAYYVLGGIHLSRGELDRARETYTRLAQVDTAGARVRVALGDIELLRGDTVTAEAWFREAARKDTLGVEPARRLGVFLAGRGDQAGAAEAFGGIVSRVERNEEYRESLLGTPAVGLYLETKLRLAVSKMNLGEWDAAIAQCEDVLELAPEHPTARQLLEGANNRQVPKFILWP
ncbi:glycosyltransferase family 39 protein [candidate division WOR-3 bacterium]|nr:glycosyltransferase family 39 protein [candidate division WOR-3 bacterium]